MLSEREADPECLGFEHIFVSLPTVCVSLHYPVLSLFPTEITFFTCSDRKREVAKFKKKKLKSECLIKTLAADLTEEDWLTFKTFSVHFELLF